MIIEKLNIAYWTEEKETDNFLSDGNKIGQFFYIAVRSTFCPHWDSKPSQTVRRDLWSVILCYLLTKYQNRWLMEWLFDR